MTLTKDMIAQTIQERLTMPKISAERMVELVLKQVKDTLSNGEDVLISGFGKFCVRSKKARRGRNPATGKDLILDPRRVVTFACSPVLRGKLNGGVRK